MEVRLCFLGRVAAPAFVVTIVFRHERAYVEPAMDNVFHKEMEVWRCDQSISKEFT